jgi:glycosyltransferase involved in cell wall biosynthesis
MERAQLHGEGNELPICVHILKDAQPECTGICRIIAGIAKHAQSSGYEISALFLGEGPLIAAMRDAGIPASAVSWTANRRDLAGAWRVWRWFREHPAEIVHMHHGGLSVRTVCRFAGVDAIVQHLHGRILEPSGDSIAGMNLRGLDAIIACSQAVADCVPGRHADVIRAGIETGSRPPAAVAPTGPLKLGVLARLIPLKNIESVIDATARLAAMGIEIRTEIAGIGPSESGLRDLAVSLGVSERVRFLGWRKDVDRLLASWDLLVIPSLEEAFPLSALEAMAAARPVVASRVGGLSELVLDGVNGILVPPGDTDALVHAIAGLAKDRKRMTLMGNEGWERARSHFSVELMARRTTELYDRLLGREPSRPSLAMPHSSS